MFIETKYPDCTSELPGYRIGYPSSTTEIWVHSLNAVNKSIWRFFQNKVWTVLLKQECWPGIVDISDSNSYLYMLDRWRGNNSQLMKECSMTLKSDW